MIDKRAPAVLLPYQQRWCADNTKVKVIQKSRRIGLSWGEAADSALLAAATNGMDVWYIGYTKDMALEFIRDSANWAKHYNHAVSEIVETMEVFKDGDQETSILAFVIRLDSGHRITALSSRPDNLRGKQGRAIIDEAAFHCNLGLLLKAAIAFLMWGGEVHIISTHNGDSNAFNELIKDIQAGKFPYSLHTVTFKDALAQGLYKRICLKLGKEWSEEGEEEWEAEIRAFYGDNASEELDCIPKNSGEAYLSRALIEARMSLETPVLRWSQPDSFVFESEVFRESTCKEWCESFLKPVISTLSADLRHFLGGDFGRSGDLTVFVPLVDERNLRRRCPFILELRNIPFAQQWQILEYILDRLPRFTGAALDARGNGQQLAETAMQKYGASRIDMVMLSEAWYRANMPPLKEAFEDGTIYDLPSDGDILADLRAFRMIKGVAKIPETRTTGADGNKRHGDAGVGVAMAYYATRELNKGPVEVVSDYRRTSETLLEGYN